MPDFTKDWETGKPCHPEDTRESKVRKALATQKVTGSSQLAKGTLLVGKSLSMQGPSQRPKYTYEEHVEVVVSRHYYNLTVRKSSFDCNDVLEKIAPRCRTRRSPLLFLARVPVSPHLPTSNVSRQERPRLWPNIPRTLQTRQPARHP